MLLTRSVAGAGPQVTIRNQTGLDLVARAVPGQDEGVVLVQTSLEPGAVHRLSPALADPAQGILAEFPLPKDAEATFQFEDGSRDRQAVLLFWYSTPEAGVVYQGTLILSQATGGGSPKATLTPAKGPTFRSLGQNKNLQILSDAEVVLR
jgi:hypothetical protein